MTTPPANALLFEVPAAPTPVEQLLALAAHYTQHNDMLDLLLADGTEPDPGAHVTSTQRLASETTTAIKSVSNQRLYENADLTDSLIRLKQLAYLSTAAAGHSPRLARELTALASEATVDSAARIAADIRRRHWSTSTAPDERLTPAHRTALREIARGHVVVTGSPGRQYVHSRNVRVLISTLRSLESHGLIEHTANSAAPAFAGGPPQDRVHLTPAGTTAFASVIGLPPTSTTTPSAAVPHTPTATKPTARSR